MNNRNYADLYCSASFCRKALGDVRSYHFPLITDKKRLQIWQNRLLAGASFSGPSSYACYQHFSEKQFFYDSNAQRTELKPQAVPDKNILKRTDNPKDPLDAVCRFCLQRSQTDYRMIFPVWPNPEVPTANEIAELFGIKITPNDVLPRLVCVTCITKIKYFKRIRDEFLKNDAILRAKFAPQVAKGPRRQRPSRKKQVPIVPPNCSSGDTVPKITAVASFGQLNPVEIPSVAPERDGILQKVYSSVVYVQEGDTIQQFQIISSEKEEAVNTSVQVEPTDAGSGLVDVVPYMEDGDEKPEDVQMKPELDSGSLHTEENLQNGDLKDHPPEKKPQDGEVEPEDVQVKIEHQQLETSSLLTEEDSQHAELEKHPPEKKLRIDKPYRNADQVKLETDET